VRAIALAAAVLAVAASAAFAARHASAVTITVTAGKPSEYAFKLSRTSVPPGTVVFEIVNRGKVKHNFAIAGKKTPVLAPGKSAKLTVVFKQAGSYTYSSSIRGQSAQGMKGVIDARIVSSTCSGCMKQPVPQGTGSAGGSTVGVPCASPAGSTINVRIFDFGFTLSQTTVPCGSVTFVIINTGQVTHNFDVESPGTNGKPVFNGGLTLLGGETASQTINFSTTGSFRYQCDLHWTQGQMVGMLTVT
jgi:plastocyanin